jgi:hypothetical protein
LSNAVKAQFRAERSKFVQHLSVLLVQAITPRQIRFAGTPGRD